jgi:uncharacterized protein (TIGR03663 family)
MRSYLRKNWIPLLLTAIAALLRLLFLAIKPPHFDEGVNGWFIDEMTRTGYFRYDPANYHGPLHFYVLFLFHTLFGRNLWSLRIPIALISAATVWLMTRYSRFLGRRVCLIAAAAMAVSPGMVFYGRYAIHESWLVFFLLLFVWGMAGLLRFGTRRYLWAAAAGITGAILIKETYLIHFIAFGLAALCAWIWEKFFRSSARPFVVQQWNPRDLAGAGAVSLFAIVFFYSGTFMDFPALTGIYETFAPWFKTGAEGHGHEKPWYYWIQLIATYEWPVLIGLAGFVRFLWPGANRLLRYIAIYACGTLAAYSLIPYKTPWCIVSILWPFFLLFGALTVDLARMLRSRAPYAMAGLILAASCGFSIWLNFFHYTDERQPYVYVQTYEDVDLLMEPLKKLTAMDRRNYHLTGHIILSSYHPLPWLLGDFSKIGYYANGSSPHQFDADFLLVEESRVEEVEEQLAGSYFVSDFQLRDAQEMAQLYLRREVFQPLFPGREPELQTAQPE